jgi:hypothetical protein
VTEPDIDPMATTVRTQLAYWVRATPPLLAIGLTLLAVAVGLTVSERSLLYGPLGFPTELAHSPGSLLAHPVVVLLGGAALWAWMLGRRQPTPQDRRVAERVRYGALLALLAYGWVVAPAQATSARHAFQDGSVRLDYPMLAPLPVHALQAKVEWRADVPTSTRVGYGRVLFVGWTGGQHAYATTWWFWDVEERHAVGVPAIQIAVVHTEGAELARPDVPTTSLGLGAEQLQAGKPHP